MEAGTEANSGPGFAKHPEHKVELAPAPGRVRVSFNGATVADSTRAIAVDESKHALVHYLPIEDVRAELLRPTEHATYCPFKGEASYWSVSVDGEVAENAVWGYKSPYDEVAGLKDHVAFYTDRVEVAVD